MYIYSPIHRLNYQALTQISVKRDDLIDPYISGNKWRKLKYVLADVFANKKSHLVTFGGAYSNHLVATAACAARNELKSTAFVRGEKVTNEMLVLCQLFGMQLIFVDRESYRDKRLLYAKVFSEDPESYFIDEGGASEEAVKGCADIISEITDTYDHIFCAAGTGTTAAGLLRGINEAGLSTTLHVIPALKNGDFIAEEINNYEKDLSKLQLHVDYHFGGYAKTTPDLIDFIKNFTASTGLLIDPVYTGKMFYAIYDLINIGKLKKDANILAIHSGGLLGIMGMKEKLFT
ncbi:1-aminocyclopropane-1-carboxylate deaminase/D-cysteine desulfhydrase [Pedobacter insulae]|uniref:1-aminocyclopropane-1-carboxylate deaminase n=1 Tax=Pedobacter insulae TaxID=414048 RepID=A0A1I2UA43_9SPHI|nr:pyridoxal-phosphate dependent enzyme [Pedobacter insulae]SFG73992.1 1-aminocyclopropane-1-carboxylate deaminase [Pedobacter insulae]